MAPHPLTAAQVQRMLDDICVGDGICSGEPDAARLNPLIEQRTPAPAATEPAAPARVVTIEDLARFVPVDEELLTEPAGWAVVGVPANFSTRVESRVVKASLLGADAEVRFTPRLYRWNYGDGTSTTTSSPGASWAALAQEEFTPTATSHVYRVKAAVDVSVTVVWSAEYRVAGSGWVPVAGAVSSDSPGVPLLVVRERTVLTNG